MTAFAHALATGPEWKSVVAAVGDQLPERDQFKGGLGMVYATESLAPHFSDIVATVRERTGVPHWVGCVGLGVCGMETE